MTTIEERATDDQELPRWSVADVHESFQARSFGDAMDRCGADMSRLEALFEEHGIRATEPRAVTATDGRAADAVITAINRMRDHADETAAYILATTTTDSYDETAEGLLGEFEMVDVRQRPLTARLADWVSSLGVEALAEHSTQVAEHRGPLEKLARRAAHQMNEAEEGLYADLVSTGSSAWDTLHGVVTSQLTATVTMPDGTTPAMPMAAIRGLATHADPAVRRAAYEAELASWPTVAPVCAAAMNAVKGEANVVNRRRGWESALAASLFANSVSRETFDAMQHAITDSLGDLRGWMHSKARLHGHSGALPWHDLVAPLPFAASAVTWDEGVDIVRNAFGAYGGGLAGIVDRALDGRWIDAGPRAGKLGGAFCMSLSGDRSLVFLNWSGSVSSAQTTAHELGHAYHNVQLAQRTPMQRSLPMALAETASIFCETLVVEEGLQRLAGGDRLALLDVDLQGALQVVVDIRSRFLFETEVFTRRQRRTLGVGELNELMLQAQADAYGDGLDQSTAHRYMWAVKPHYYSSHFYNWPYAYGLLFGLGLFAQYKQDPERFKSHYDDALSRAGINSAEELGAVFGFDVSDQAFWTASLDVIRDRIADYDALAVDVTAVDRA
ncbi:MAG: M3 family oligoendopeptidase [Actinobacteria bacterium]|nr:M3 family oligoendopeptidase [Actinomycetota bacterium]